VAHKVVLSACSPFFSQVLKKNHHHTHPLIFLSGIKFNFLQSILDFAYEGEARVAQKDVNAFLVVTKELQVKGLHETEETPRNLVQPHPPPLCFTARLQQTPGNLAHSVAEPPNIQARPQKSSEQAPGSRHQPILFSLQALREVLGTLFALSQILLQCHHATTSLKKTSCSSLLLRQQEFSLPGTTTRKIRK